MVRSETSVLVINGLKGISERDPVYQGILQAAEYLKANLMPGDKVLPLDDVGMANHSMLLAEAETASYYPYEIVFGFLETSFPNSKYMHDIHKDYVKRFSEVRPRFVIDFSGARHFPELEESLGLDYTKIPIEHGIIYERKKNCKR